MNNISEVKRQAVKTVLMEMYELSAPIKELTIKCIQQDWDEAKFQGEMVKLLRETDMTKTYDYYTERIMSIFIESEANNG